MRVENVLDGINCGQKGMTESFLIGHGRYFSPEKESCTRKNSCTSRLYPGDHYQRFTGVNDTSPHIEEQNLNQSTHCRQATVTTQRSFVNDTSSSKEESSPSLNIKITSTFSLNPNMSSTSSSYGMNEVFLSSNHTLPTRPESEPGESQPSSCFSPCPVLWQQHVQMKNEVPKHGQLQASLAIPEEPRCSHVHEDANADSRFPSDENRNQRYTKLGKSRNIESKNQTEVWSNNSLGNEDDMKPLKDLLYTVPPNNCYISNENDGPSLLLHRDIGTKIQGAFVATRKEEVATKSNGLDQHETVSIRNRDQDSKTQYSAQTEDIDSKTPAPVVRYQQDISGPKSLSFTTIRRTKQAQECDESIAIDMITHGMPSSLSTASGEHHLPMVLSSHTNNDSDKQFKSSEQRRLANYTGKVRLPWRLHNLSPDSFNKFKMTKEAQLQQSNVHRGISSSNTHPDNEAVPLMVMDKGEKELKKPVNFKSVDSKRKCSNVQFLITPAPETFKNLEMQLGLQNDEEPVVKMPNYFLDFTPEYRPNDPSTPRLVDISNANIAVSSQALVSKSQQGCFPCHKVNGKSVDNVVEKHGMYEKQTHLENTMPLENVTKETKVLLVVKPPKKSVVSFLETTSPARHFAFSSSNDEEPKYVPTCQVFAGVSCLPANEIHPQGNNPMPAELDEYQEKCPLLGVPIKKRKRTGDTRYSNPANTYFESISDFRSLLPRSGEDDCKLVKSQFLVVSSGINTEKCYQYNVHGKRGVIKKNPRCFSDESNNNITQEHVNSTTSDRKDSVTHRESGFPLSWSPKHRILIERETSIPKDINILPELESSKPTNSITADEFLFHSSGHGFLNGSSGNEMISTCIRASVVENSTTAVPLDERKHQCEVCGRAFSRSNTLITHKRIHTGDRPFPCDLCGRSFRQLGNLTRHKLTHAAVKPHACPKCNKCFSRTSNLNTHMRTHTNYKPFICDFCGKGFHQKVDMKIHRYTHTGEKPHKCSKCGRGFKQLTHLKYHMRTHSAVRLYKCEHCGKGFNQKGNLQAHIYGHTGNRPYRCDICGKGFTLTSTLNTHKRTHAPNKPFKCEFCEKAFYQKNALKTHYISSHPYTDGVCLL